MKAQEKWYNEKEAIEITRSWARTNLLELEVPKEIMAFVDFDEFISSNAHKYLKGFKTKKIDGKKYYQIN